MSTSNRPTTKFDFEDLAASYDRSTGGATRVIARHLISSLNPPLSGDSVLLDNATGTGLVLEELFAQHPDLLSSTNSTPTIHAADLAPSMVAYLRTKTHSLSWPNVHLTVSGGEHLPYPDDTFSHSITNFGLMFFSSPEAGARQIHRTLRPGGIAYVTTWHVLGHLAPFRAAEERVRAGKAGGEFPLRKEWEEGEFARGVMVSGGFEDGRCRVYEQEGWMRAGSVGELAANVEALVKPMMGAWTEEEKGLYQRFMEEELEKIVEFVEVEDRREVRLKMVANVIVCQK